MNSTLTILTPTYNRAQYLPKCYESLKNQTNFDFEWLIVDDGSTDSTEETVNEWISDISKCFDIEYVKKPNGGKHTALNYSTDYIRGSIVLILDSDDYLTGDAVDTVLNAWKDYSHDKKICGMSFLRGTSIEEPIARFDKDVVRSNHIDYRINNKINGDCCEIIRTDVLKEFPFPVYEGERFIGENYLWINAALKYDTVYINKIIYICEYLEGGLTKSGRPLRMKNPLGGMTTSKLGMNKRICLKERVKNAILYSCYAFATKMRIIDIIKSSGHPVLAALFLPVGRWF